MSKNVILALSLLTLLPACSKEKLSSESVLNPLPTPSALDTWCIEHITTPYQAEVIYKWDRNQAPKATFTYPPQEDKVRPVLEALDAIVLKLYKDKSLFPEKVFFSQNPILRIYLYGGANLDERGIDLPFDRNTPSVELRLYNVDKFDPTNRDEVYRLVRSAQHQIAKHLFNIHPYDHNTFLSYSRSRYTQSTEAFSDAYKSYQREGTALSIGMGLNRYAWSRGFYSILGMLSPREDLAEMYSVTLTSTPSAINQAEADAAIPDRADGDTEAEARYRAEAKEAHQAFVNKRAFLSSYLSSEWQIPLQRLQIHSLTLMNQYLEAHATVQP